MPNKNEKLYKFSISATKSMMASFPVSQVYKSHRKKIKQNVFARIYFCFPNSRMEKVRQLVTRTESYANSSIVDRNFLFNVLMFSPLFLIPFTFFCADGHRAAKMRVMKILVSFTEKISPLELCNYALQACLTDKRFPPELVRSGNEQRSNIKKFTRRRFGAFWFFCRLLITIRTLSEFSMRVDFHKI